MKVMKIEDVPEILRTGGIFTDTVSVKTLIGDESKDLMVSIVNFPKGVRNVLHAHLRSMPLRSEGKRHNC